MQPKKRNGNSSLPRDLSKALSCVQCGKCSSGCPVAFDTQHTPRRILRFLQWGWLKEASCSPFVMLCAECKLCAVRCPRGVAVSEIALALRRLARKEGWIRPDRFHRTFEEMIERKGRISELRLGLVASLGRRPLHPIEDLLLFLKMLWRGKMR